MKETYKQINKKFKLIEKNNQIQLRFHKELEREVKEATSFLDENATNSERIYCIRNYIYEKPKCLNCNKTLIYKQKSLTYGTYCSVKCSNSCVNKKRKTVKTNLEKYGVDNVMKNDIIKEKSKNNNDLNSCYEKMKKTMDEKYGTSISMNIPEIKHKMQNTVIERYNTNNVMKNPEIAKRLSVNNLKKGFDILLERKDFLEHVTPLFNKEDYKGRFGNNIYKCNFCNLEFEDWVDSTYKFIPRCPKCFPKETSIFEEEVFKFLKDILPMGTKIQRNNREKIKPYELDIFVPEYNLAIECNGLLWHSEYKHENPYYHRNKYEECKKKKIRLIQIFEDEWKFKKEIVKSKIISIFKLNNKEKIYARKCYIKEVSNNDKNDFLTLNHIQGKDVSCLNLGLYYDEKLISILTLSKPRMILGQKDKKDCYELSRFASDINFHVIGAFSKLLSYLTKNYTINELITYADLRWSEGNIYYCNGFTYIGRSKPSYWYIKRSTNIPKRFHRSNFMKFKLKNLESYNENLTEKEIMKKEGFLRIWDVGNLVFKYN